MTSINRVSFFVMGFLSPLVLARLGSSDIVAPFIAFVLFAGIAIVSSGKEGEE